MRYRKIIDRFKRRWGRIFSEEYPNSGDAASKPTGAVLTVTKSDGTVITIRNRADGQIQMRSSANPNVTTSMSPELFCSSLGI